MMKNREYNEWSNNKRIGFKSFFFRWVIGISTGTAVGKASSVFIFDSYKWAWSMECYIDIFVIFITQWLLSAVLGAIIAPLYWSYGMRKLAKYRIQKD